MVRTTHVSRILNGALVWLCGAVVAAGCSSGESDNANAQGAGDTIGTTKRLLVVESQDKPYQVVTRSDTGSVSGHVIFEGLPRGDTVYEISAEENGCNKPISVKRLERKDGKVANTVVWLTDIRAGRALPLERRYELRNRDCAWSPSVQAVVTSGTINLFNEDPLVENASVINVSSGDTVGVAPFTDGGQVIPYHRLLRAPGLFEFSIESRPQSRAWVIVLDHPYFDVTKSDGAFTINGIPAGQYMLRVWHPMLGVLDNIVTIQANQTATLDPHFR